MQEKKCSIWKGPRYQYRWARNGSQELGKKSGKLKIRWRIETIHTLLLGPSSNFKKRPCWGLLEKSGCTHKQLSATDSYIGQLIPVLAKAYSSNTDVWVNNNSNNKYYDKRNNNNNDNNNNNNNNGSPNPGQKTRPHNNQQKKREFAKLSTLLSRRTTE